MTETQWFEFSQNNSFGEWDHDPDTGIGYEVWIEATGPEHANERAEQIGLYFDGSDCPCCGNRWHETWGSGRDDAPTTVDLIFDWGVPSYAHPLEGEFYQLTDRKARF